MIESIENVRFLNVCFFIKDNYKELSEELNDIADILETTSILHKAYADKNMIRAHIENYEERDYPMLILLRDKLDLIKKEAVTEFFQGVDFLSMKEDMLIANNKDNNLFSYILKAKKVLAYLNYQIDRIKRENDTSKQIAIFKGMIAFS